MRTISETFGGAQFLLSLNYEIQEYFETPLTKEQLRFVNHLRIIMEYAEILHERIVKVVLENSIIGDLSLDSTAIATREK
jgi:hypothetical protein